MVEIAFDEFPDGVKIVVAHAAQSPTGQGVFIQANADGFVRLYPNLIERLDAIDAKLDALLAAVGGEPS
jgi:hypothetical protein